MRTSLVALKSDNKSTTSREMTRMPVPWEPRRWLEGLEAPEGSLSPPILGYCCFGAGDSGIGTRQAFKFATKKTLTSQSPIVSCCRHIHLCCGQEVSGAAINSGTGPGKSQGSWLRPSETLYISTWTGRNIKLGNLQIFENRLYWAPKSILALDYDEGGFWLRFSLLNQVIWAPGSEVTHISRIQQEVHLFSVFLTDNLCEMLNPVQTG